MIEDFQQDPVGPFYNGIGKQLGDQVVLINVDTSKQPLNLNPSPITIKEIPIIPILLLGGIVIYLLLNR